MNTQSFTRRTAIAALCLAAHMVSAQAQTSTPIRFQLDWRFEGPGALFLLPAEKGYFKDNGLDVTIDVGSGSGAAVARVASGAYDMGFADMGVLMEFHANNPDVPNKPIAIMMVYNNSAVSALTLKKNGINQPSELSGKKIGAPIFDSGRKAFPIFAKANNISNVNWVTMDVPLKETMLVKGDVDAIVGFSFTMLLNMEARGVKQEDVNLWSYTDSGVKFYGSTIIVSPQFAERNPEAVKAFLRAFTKGVKEVVANPEKSIPTVKNRDGLINVALETKRLELALKSSLLTPDAKREGFGNIDPARLAVMAGHISDVFGVKQRVEPAGIWNGSFLPSAAERNIFGN
jgi:NitT/TauT family transport system substrate-binding protein